MGKQENLKRGNPETEFRGQYAVECQKKAVASKMRNNSLRKLGRQMLQTSLDLSVLPDGAQALAGIKAMGFDTDKPELQMLILARLGALAISTIPEVAIAATKLLIEITGDDARTLNAHEQRTVERERIALEREKFEALHKADDAEALAKLDALIGGIDAIAGEAHNEAQP